MSRSTFRVGGHRTWLGVLTLVAVFGGVEIGALALLGHTFLAPPLAWTIDVAGVLLLAITAVAIASVLWRPHRIDDSEALLVLGYLGEIRIPRGDISAIVVVAPLAGVEADQTGPTWSEDTLNLVAATGVPRLRVDLVAPRPGRRLWQRRLVTSVEVSDETGALAAALAT